jgi:potassium voltage-gated channel Eag-related subfamily H protein 7
MEVESPIDEQRRPSKMAIGKAERLGHGTKVGQNIDHLALYKEMSKMNAGRESSCVINPEGNSLLQKWDVFIFLALIYTSVVTPFEVGFLETKLWTTLFYINRTVDVIFIIDIVLQFFIMYEEHHPVYGSKWIGRRKKIVKHYLKGWFAPDVISTIPFDLLASEEFGALIGMKPDPAFQKLKVIRTIRLLRLVKLVRIFKASRMFQRYQNEVTTSFRVLMMGRFLALLILVGHWTGCIIGMIGMQTREQNEGWMEYFRLNFYAEKSDPGLYDLYIACVYWSVMTITSIGYGDIVMQTTQERLIATIIMLVGGCMWAFIIGQLSGMLASLDAESMRFYEALDSINAMARERAIPKPICRRLRSYWHQARVLKRLLKYRDLCGQMSPTLQGQVAYATNEFWIKHVYFFRYFSSPCLAEIFQMVDTNLFEPHEHFANPWTLYVLNKGLVGRKGTISSAGACWGQDQLLLVCFNLLEDYRAVAHTYAELLTLKRGHFEQVLKFFPREEYISRKAHARLAFSAGIRFLARKAKEGKQDIGFTSMMDFAWSDQKKGEGTENKIVHLGIDDTNPDWDGFEHLNLAGMTSYKVDRMEERVLGLLKEIRDMQSGADVLREGLKSGENDGEHNSGDSGEPLPEPGQLAPDVVTWDGIRPFLTAVERIEKKMDTICEQQAEAKRALETIRSKVSLPKAAMKVEKGWCEAPKKSY